MTNKIVKQEDYSCLPYYYNSKKQETQLKEQTMTMKVHKAKKSQESYLNDLRDGKPVKAIDLMASMGIKTIVIK